MIHKYTWLLVALMAGGSLYGLNPAQMDSTNAVQAAFRALHAARVQTAAAEARLQVAKFKQPQGALHEAEADWQKAKTAETGAFERSRALVQQKNAETLEAFGKVSYYATGIAGMYGKYRAGVYRFIGQNYAEGGLSFIPAFIISSGSMIGAAFLAKWLTKKVITNHMVEKVSEKVASGKSTDGRVSWKECLGVS